MKFPILVAAVLTICPMSSAWAAELYGFVAETPSNTVKVVRSASGSLAAQVAGSNNARGTSASAEVYVDYGIHKNRSVSNSEYTFEVGATTLSRWDDALTVLAPTNGFINVAVDVSATMDAEGPGYSSSAFLYRLFNPNGYYQISYRSDELYSIGFNSEIVRDDGSTISRYAVIKIPFISGTQFGLRSELYCNVNGQRSSICDAGNSAYWGGVLSVTDERGNSIDDWTITSDSGTDYRFSFVPVSGVPEPSTWAMLIVGFAIIGSASRNRRSRRAMHPLTVNL